MHALEFEQHREVGIGAMHADKRVALAPDQRPALARERVIELHRTIARGLDRERRGDRLRYGRLDQGRRRLAHGEVGQIARRAGAHWPSTSVALTSPGAA